jgi:hypothetical protein
MHLFEAQSSFFPSGVEIVFKRFKRVSLTALSTVIIRFLGVRSSSVGLSQ